MPTEGVEIETPLERMTAQRISGKKVAVCPVLRAGMGMLDGVLSLISSARVGFIGLYRDEETLEPVEYFVKLPTTSTSATRSCSTRCSRPATRARPRSPRSRGPARTSVTLVCLVAAPEGIEHLVAEHPDVRIVCAAVDRGLNERGFIVPGLGDAGDRLYGTK